MYMLDKCKFALTIDKLTEIKRKFTLWHSSFFIYRALFLYLLGFRKNNNNTQW